MIALLLFLVMNVFAQDACMPPVRYIPLPPNNENRLDYGQYMRVHPSGKYIMLSGCNSKSEKIVSGNSTVTSVDSFGVCIIDLTNANETTPGKLIPTDMVSEAYPLEPDWQFIASPNHNEGTQMNYYSFDSLLKTPAAQQKPFATDSFNEFYHSMARTSPNSMRMMTWSDMQYKDFRIGSSNGAPTLQGSDVKLACQNLMGSNFNYQEYKTLKDKLIKGYNAVSPCIEKVHQQQIAGKIPPQEDAFEKCASPELKAMADRFDVLSEPVNQALENPILSKDGRELGALNDGKITIMSLDDKGNCSIKERINFRGSKVNFSHPVVGKKGRIAFTNVASGMDDFETAKRLVYVYDRDSKKLLPVGVEPTADSYPGFTKDGNLMYLTRGTDYRLKIAIVDLKNFNFDSCPGEVVPAAAVQ